MLISIFFAVVLLSIVYRLFDNLMRMESVGRYGDRYVLVTGCDTGFGNLLVKRLDALGCRVFACCLTDEGQRQLRRLCSHRLSPIHMDVSRSDSVREALDCVTKELPIGKGLWGVVNNAGIDGDRLGPADWMTVDDYKHLNSVNLYGVIDVTMTFLPLVKKERGRVIVTSSLLGRVTAMIGLPYCVSKHAVESFVDGLRVTLRPFDCRAILIEPGLYLTSLTRLDHMKLALTNAWNEAGQDTRDDYGQEYFDYLMEKGLRMFQSLGGRKVGGVISAYEQALFSRRPRPRYLLGSLSTLIVSVALLLPESIGDWVCEKLTTASCPHPPSPPRRVPL